VLGLVTVDFVHHTYTSRLREREGEKGKQWGKEGKIDKESKGPRTKRKGQRERHKQNTQAHL
jgi:hypothetical protein